MTSNSLGYATKDRTGKGIIESQGIVHMREPRLDISVQQTKMTINNISYNSIQKQAEQIAQTVTELQALVKDEVLIEYSDYLKVKQFCQSHIFILRYFGKIQLEVSSQNCSSHSQQPENRDEESPSYRGQRKSTNQHSINAHHQLKMGQTSFQLQQINKNLYRKIIQKTGEYKISPILLICAKFYYIQKQYQKCIHFIESYFPITEDLGYKILYERTILYFKAAYLSSTHRQLSKIFQSIYQQYLSKQHLCYDLKYFDKLQHYNKYIQTFKNRILQKNVIFSSYLSKVQVIRTVIQTIKNTRIKIYEGIPFFLVSSIWINKAKKFLQNIKQQTFPGPVLNLQLQNHIFEFQGHKKPQKTYLNRLLFPVVEQIDYFYCKSSLWKLIESQLDGIKIKRFAGCERDKLQKNINNTTVLTVFQIQSQRQKFALQWQNNLYWQHSLLPYIQDFFGKGQLKIIINKKNNRKVDFKQIQVVKAGPILKCKHKYRYINYQPYLVYNLKPQLLKDISIKYDLQQYELTENRVKNSSLAVIAIDQTKLIQYDISSAMNSLQSKRVIRPSQKVLTDVNVYRKALLRYLPSIAVCLANIVQFVDLFTTNKFVLNFAQKPQKQVLQSPQQLKNNQYIKFCFSFANLIKKMWFSDSNQESININLFYEDSLKILQGGKLNCQKISSAKEEKVEKKREIINHYEIIQNIILGLHKPMNSPTSSVISTVDAQKLRKLQMYYSMEQMMMYGVQKFKKKNQSILLQLFKQFHYQILECPMCQFRMNYKLIPSLFMNVEVVQYFQYLKLFFVCHERRPQSAQIILSTRQFIDLQYQISLQKNWNSVVRQVTVKVAKNKKTKLSTIYQVLSKQFGKNLVNSQSQYVSIICDDRLTDFHQIHSSLQSGQRDMRIKRVNKLLTRNKQGICGNLEKTEINFLLFIFLVPRPSQKEQLILINYRNSKSRNNINFPEIIKVDRCSLFLKEDKLPKEIKGKISYSKIQISSCEMFTIRKNSQRKMNVNFSISVFTETNMGVGQRLKNNICLEQKFDVLQQGDRFVRLQDCLQCSYCEKSLAKLDSQTVNKYIAEIQKNEALLSSEGAHCPKCNRMQCPVIHKKLLQVHKIIIIVLNRKATQSKFKILTQVKIPITGLNIRLFSSVEQANKAKPLLYNLKAAIIWKSSKTSIQETDQLKYVSVVYNHVRKKWYLYENQSVKQIDISVFDISTAQVLFYQRDSKNQYNRQQ